MQTWEIFYCSGCVCVQGGREEEVVGSGVMLQSGTLAVWNAGRGQSQMGALSVSLSLPTAAVFKTVSRLPSLLPHPVLFPPSPVCAPSTKAWGPSLAWTQLSSAASLSQLAWSDTKSVQELPEVVKQTESGAQEAAIQIVWCAWQLQPPQG